MISQGTWARSALWPAVTALAYLLSAALGEALAFPSAPVSALWAPNAILFAALLLAPVNRWWLYLVAIFPCHVLAQVEDTPFSQIGIQYVVNCAEALISAAALLRLEAEPRRLGQLSAMTNLVLIGGIAAPLITSVAMAMAFVSLGLTDDFWLTVIARTSTNAFAAITVVPLIVHFAEAPGRGWRIPTRGMLLETSCIGVCLALVSVYVFVWPGIHDERAPALLYAPLPLLIWATVRYEIVGVCASVLLVGACATWGVVHEVGPFVVHSPVRNALTTVLFLNVMCIPLLMLAAVLQERKATVAEAVRRDQQLAHLSRVATLGEISGAVAHEIRQPLASMLANAEAAAALLQSGRADMASVKPIVADIIADNRRAAQVIRRMQSMLRFSQTDRKLEQLNDLVLETLALSRGDLHRRQVIAIQSLGDELPRVLADRVQIQQVILNLIVNACDAMEGIAPDQRRLWITTSARPRHGVELTVRDSGPGLDDAMLERIFDPFVSTKPTGLGLGLSISHKIIASHGGQLWAERSAGGGAIFRLILP
ncbi:ATP-binding protein [Peristeroidobacter soli]|uniref:ATP-binding protein n=1 Tax=Peristeroidobacter soli TaxID=2497877 RepID=UPI00101DED1C|nr:ATP-binding protein [Peristeroidobacter soli]